MLDPAFRQAIVSNTWDHVLLTAGGPGVLIFEIAVCGVAYFKPEIEEQGPHICNLSQGDRVKAGIS